MKPPHRSSLWWLYAALLGAGMLLRAIDLWRPVDGTVREAWRECDIAAVARNFYVEGMNILYPRIDWRGDGPGFAEMEFPGLSWSIAVLYKIFGFHEHLGRIVPFAFSVASLVVFLLLAARYLKPTASVIALAFFVASPLGIRTSNSLQPEAVMLCLLLLAVYGFMRWLEEGGSRWFWLTAVGTACALLAKINAAHIGLFFLGLLLVRKGMSSLWSTRIWVLALVAVLPAALWYAHAHQLWLAYHNSLGLSNEYIWFGWEFFTNRRFLLGIVRIEALFVWMPLGWLVGAYALRKERGPTVQAALIWLGVVFVYYVATSRTTSEDWAIYYHVVSVPPAAMLFGAGAGLVVERWGHGARRALSAAFFLALAVVAGRLALGFAPTIPAAIVVTLVAAGLLTASAFRKGLPKRLSQWRARVAESLVLFSAASTFVFLGFRIAKDVHPRHMQAMYECAEQIGPAIAEDALIVTSGGHKLDEDGYPLAINAPYLFYWLGHKGFSLAVEDQSIAALAELASRGARYFVAEREALAQQTGFEEELRQRFPLLAECDELELFLLTREGADVHQHSFRAAVPSDHFGETQR